MTYLDRKVSGICVYAGCARHADEYVLCDEHQLAHRRRNARHMRRVRGTPWKQLWLGLQSTATG